MSKNKKKEEPLIVKGSFDDLIKVSVAGNPAPKPKGKRLTVEKITTKQELKKVLDKANKKAKNKKTGE